MARLVKTIADTLIYLNIDTVHEDSSVESKKLKIGDIVTGLRYVSNSEVLSVSGKIIDIRYTFKRTSNYDTFMNNLKPISIIVDASTEYSSNVVTVPVNEIVEDEGVLTVERMRTSMDVELLLTLTYTDGTSVNQSLIVGDTITDAKIMTEPLQPDLEGDFTIVGFIFDATSTKVKINGIVVEDADARYEIPNAKIIKFVEATNATIDSPEDIVRALSDPTIPVVTLSIQKDIEFSEPIQIPAGKKVTLELGNSKLTVPAVAEGEKSAYLIENSGDLTINGGNVSTRGLINNATGTMTINGLTAVCEDFVGGATLTNNGGSVVINDCDFSTSYVGSVQEAKGVACIRNHGDLVINKGNLHSVNQRGYVIISDGNIDLTSDEITVAGAHGGLAVDGGTCHIAGGTYSSQNFYGLYVSNDDLTADVHVTDGKFIGKNYSVWCGSDDNESVDSVVYLEGGTYDKPIKDQNNVAPGAGCKVSGGKFKALDTAYIMDGYKLSDEADADGYYTIEKITE